MILPRNQFDANKVFIGKGHGGVSVPKRHEAVGDSADNLLQAPRVQWNTPRTFSAETLKRWASEVPPALLDDLELTQAEDNIQAE